MEATLESDQRSTEGETLAAASLETLRSLNRAGSDPPAPLE